MISHLTVAKPLPNEISIGYAGRVAALNGYPSVNALMVALGSDRSVIMNQQALAQLAGMSVDDYVMSHTLIPYNAFVVANAAAYEGNSLRRFEHLLKRRDPSMTSIPRHCPACVREDLSFWGHAYWRRDHQLVGQWQCATHGAPLVVMPEAQLTSMPPQIPAGHSNCFRSTEVDNPFVRRFEDISIALLQRRKSVTTRQMVHLLSRRARQRNIARSRSGTGESFGALASRVLPNEWLADLLDNKTGRDTQFKLRNLDYVLRRTARCWPFAYVLGMALLFDSTDDALNALGELDSEQPQAIRSKRRLDECFWSRPEVDRAYIECRGSQPAVGRRLNVDTRDAIAGLEHRGLPYFGLRQEGDLYRLAFIAFSEGQSLEQVCTQFALDRERLLGAIRIATHAVLPLVKKIPNVRAGDAGVADQRPPLIVTRYRRLKSRAKPTI